MITRTFNTGVQNLCNENNFSPAVFIQAHFLRKGHFDLTKPNLADAFVNRIRRLDIKIEGYFDSPYLLRVLDKFSFSATSIILSFCLFFKAVLCNSISEKIKMINVTLENL